MTEIDVIIISFAKTPDLLAVTNSAILTLLDSETGNDIKFNLFVVESNHNINYDYPNSIHTITTIHPDVPFGYHTYLNIGLKAGSAEWTCLCNND